MVPKEHRNPVKALPYDEGAFDTYKKYGYLMFPQQRAIYSNIAKRIDPHSIVLEVGCGIGLGTAMLDRSLTTKVIGTDNLPENVKIAKALYPWIRFEEFDICSEPLYPSQPIRYDVVVAVEVIEHVSDAQLAISRLCTIALKEVWISTPNGTGKKRPPENPYHVCEFLPEEVKAMVPKGWGLQILEYQNFNPVDDKSLSLENPLVYRLTKVSK